MKAFLYSPVQSHPPVLRFLNRAGYCAVSDCRAKLSLFAQETGAAHSQVLTLLSLSGVAATCSSKSSSVSMLTNSSPIAAARKNKTIFVRVLSLEYFTWSNTSKQFSPAPSHLKSSNSDTTKGRVHVYAQIKRTSTRETHTASYASLTTLSTQF